MRYEQRDLVLLSYPFTDKKGSKVRPAIVVSNANFNKKCQDYVMVPLTSVIKDKPFSILINQEDLSKGKLIKESRVRIDKLFTLDKNLVRMRIGSIKDKTFDRIKKEIIRIF